MSLALLGFAILFCTFPFLCAAGVYTYTTIDSYIIYATPLLMWLAIIASVLGSFTAASFTYGKYSVHDLVFSGLSGAIVFSSSSDLNFNSCVPLVMGYLFGFMSSLYSSSLHRKFNKDGITQTYSYMQSLLVPGLFSAVLAAILQAVGQTDNGLYVDNYFTATNSGTGGSRSYIGQGGFQMLGLVVTAVFGLATGVMIGIMYKVINRY